MTIQSDPSRIEIRDTINGKTYGQSCTIREGTFNKKTRKKLVKSLTDNMQKFKELHESA